MIIYNGKSSYTDFDLYVAAKEIPAPQRKVITETVPYMSGVWDFSYHDNGVDEYEALKLKYSFDVIADTKRELSEQKAALLAWLHEKTDGKLYDTDISLTKYYKVYHAQASWSENDLQGLLTVEFLCYPFMLTDKTITQALTATAQSITVENEGVRVAAPMIRVASKNLWKTQSVVDSFETAAGFTYTYDNGIFTFRGKTANATGGGRAELSSKSWAKIILPKGTYTYSVNVISGNMNDCLTFMQIIKDGVLSVLKNYTFTLQKESEVTFGINRPTETGVDIDVTFQLQIEKGEIATKYEPYVEATATINSGTNSYALSAGSYNGLLTLDKGANTITAKGAGVLYIEYAEEAF